MFADNNNSNNSDVDPRVQGMTDALAKLNVPELDFHWAAVTDYDGLVLANFPPDSDSDLLYIAAAAAHLLRAGERAIDELEFGKWRYTLLAGSTLQQIVVHLNKEVILTIGYGSRIPLYKIFAAVKGVVPDLVRSLDITSRKFSEPNTMVMRQEDLQKMLRAS